MSLDMSGHIDSTFESIPVVRVEKAASQRVNGRVVRGAPTNHTGYTATVQPLSDRQKEILTRAGKRILDSRNLYINNGDIQSINLTDDWQFNGQSYQCIELDNRPWRNYCKVVVSRYDA